jgi:hypothetical protein
MIEGVRGEGDGRDERGSKPSEGPANRRRRCLSSVKGRTLDQVLEAVEVFDRGRLETDEVVPVQRALDWHRGRELPRMTASPTASSACPLCIAIDSPAHGEDALAKRFRAVLSS